MWIIVPIKEKTGSKIRLFGKTVYTCVIEFGTPKSSLSKKMKPETSKELHRAAMRQAQFAFAAGNHSFRIVSECCEFSL
jgi:hypothetical protein